MLAVTPKYLWYHFDVAAVAEVVAYLHSPWLDASVDPEAAAVVVSRLLVVDEEHLDVVDELAVVESVLAAVLELAARAPAARATIVVAVVAAVGERPPELPLLVALSLVEVPTHVSE